MKKKIFGAVLIAAMAVAAGWSFNQSKNEVDISNLAANIEALALGEVSSTCTTNCTFDYQYQCHVFGPGTMGPTYCFYFRAR